MCNMCDARYSMSVILDILYGDRQISNFQVEKHLDVICDFLDVKYRVGNLNITRKTKIKEKDPLNEWIKQSLQNKGE